MSAAVYRSPDGWMVSLRVAGEEVDEAGPFDEELDALLVARRSVHGDGSVTEGQ